jgi:hypothetical protein
VAAHDGIGLAALGLGLRDHGAKHEQASVPPQRALIQ